MTKQTLAEARKAKIRRMNQLQKDPNSVPHGDVNTYNNYGCRCEPCIFAKSIQYHEYMVKQNPRFYKYKKKIVGLLT